MSARLTAALMFTAAFLFGFTATAAAAGEVVPVDGSLLDLARPIYDAVMSHEYLASAAFALVLAAALFKRYAPGKAGEFARGDFGGTLLVFAMSFGGALGTAALAAESLSWNLAGTSFLVGLTAIGGYVGIKKLVVDPVMSSRWYNEKAPAWLKALLNLAVLWVFTKRDSASAVGAAETAGANAVAASQPSGADGVVGKPTDL